MPFAFGNEKLSIALNRKPAWLMRMRLRLSLMDIPYVDAVEFAESSTDRIVLVLHCSEAGAKEILFEMVMHTLKKGAPGLVT